MTIWNVQLNAWASPCIVEAHSMADATRLALKNFPTCDCCGEPTKVVGVMERVQPVPFYSSVIMEVK